MSEIFTPYGYQEESIDRVLNSTKNEIECSSTGSGKTIMQAFVCKRAMDRGERTAILTPRAEIFDQTHTKLNEIVGLGNVSTLRSGFNWNPQARVHVVSWPTLIKRMQKSESWLPSVDRVLVDECHLSMAPQVLKILKHYESKAVVTGYSATPARKNGKGLGEYFTEINVVRTTRQLIGSGHLTPNEYWGGAFADMKGVKSQAGDYATGETSKRCVELVGDIVDNWLRLASEKKTIVFAVDIAHAEALMDRFLDVGIVAAALHNKMSDQDRLNVVADFGSGVVQVLVNVTIASYGFDVPDIECVVCARPTKSVVLWLQMLGRGMRLHPGKEFCMVLDHADNVRQLGQAEDEYYWSLDHKETGVTNKTKQEKEEKSVQDFKCEKCEYLFSGTRECPRCGHEVPFTAKDIAVVDADLVRIGNYQAESLGKGWPPHQAFYQMLRWYATKHGKKSEWAWHKYKEKAGHPPLRDWKDLAQIPPVPRVHGYIKKCNIAYAMGRGRMRK